MDQGFDTTDLERVDVCGPFRELERLEQENAALRRELALRSHHSSPPPPLSQYNHSDAERKGEST